MFLHVWILDTSLDTHIMGGICMLYDYLVRVHELTRLIGSRRSKDYLRVVDS